MTDYGRYKLSRAEAKAKVDEYDAMTDVEFADQLRHWSVYDVSDDSYAPVYKEVRDAIVIEFRKVLTENNNQVNYNLDLSVGLKLYEALSPTSGFNNVIANDDDVWRYISVCVMPDLTFIRYPNKKEDAEILAENIPGLTYAIGIKSEKDSGRIKKKRFYSHTRRIWLKTLWWYIHLGWQGSTDLTFEILKNNGTNIISHFIERPGRGYRPTLFRAMLYAYAMLPEQKDSVFRAAGKLNLAKCVSVEPALTEGGEKRYAEQLFKEVLEKEPKKEDAEGSDSKELAK